MPAFLIILALLAAGAGGAALQNNADQGTIQSQAKAVEQANQANVVQAEAVKVQSQAQAVQAQAVAQQAQANAQMAQANADQTQAGADLIRAQAELVRAQTAKEQSVAAFYQLLGFGTFTVSGVLVMAAIMLVVWRRKPVPAGKVVVLPPTQQPAQQIKPSKTMIIWSYNGRRVYVPADWKGYENVGRSRYTSNFSGRY